jgi:hypothetical protein
VFAGMGSGRFSFLFVGVIKASASEPSFAFLDSQTLVIPHHRDGLYFKVTPTLMLFISVLTRCQILRLFIKHACLGNETLSMIFYLCQTMSSLIFFLIFFL